MAVLDTRSKDPIAVRIIESDPSKVAKAILPYQKEGKVYVGYEAHTFSFCS